jgi:hypothetical protein
VEEIDMRRSFFANARYVSLYFTEFLQAIALPTKNEFQTVTTLTDGYYYSLPDSTYQLTAFKN